MSATLGDLVATTDLPVPVRHAIARRAAGPATATQLAGIPAAVAHTSVCVHGPTGSGKTLVAAVAAAHALRAGASDLRQPRVLVLCPTRELAEQVGEVIGDVLAGLGLRTVVVVGPPVPRRDTLTFSRPADCLVTTPGRALNLLQRCGVRLADAALCVLDEADLLLGASFAAQTSAVLAATALSQGTTRLLALSATTTAQVHEQLRRLHPDPLHIVGTPTADTPAAQPLTVLTLPGSTAPESSALGAALSTIIAHARSAMVFIPRRRDVPPTVELLHAAGHAVAGLSGTSTPTHRRAALHSLATGQITALVCTDIAARGIDIPHLDVVVHCGVPHAAAELVHRSGRTGRGATPPGVVVLICGAAHLPQVRAMAADVGWQIRATSSVQTIVGLLEENVTKKKNTTQPRVARPHRTAPADHTRQPHRPIAPQGRKALDSDKRTTSAGTPRRKEGQRAKRARRPPSET